MKRKTLGAVLATAVALTACSTAERGTPVAEPSLYADAICPEVPEALEHSSRETRLSNLGRAIAACVEANDGEVMSGEAGYLTSLIVRADKNDFILTAYSHTSAADVEAYGENTYQASIAVADRTTSDGASSLKTSSVSFGGTDLDQIQMSDSEKLLYSKSEYAAIFGNEAGNIIDSSGKREDITCAERFIVDSAIQITASEKGDIRLFTVPDQLPENCLT